MKKKNRPMNIPESNYQCKTGGVNRSLENWDFRIVISESISLEASGLDIKCRWTEIGFLSCSSRRRRRRGESFYDDVIASRVESLQLLEIWSLIKVTAAAEMTSLSFSKFSAYVIRR